MTLLTNACLIMSDLHNMVAFRPDVLLHNADKLVTYAYVTSNRPQAYEHLPVFILREMARVAQVNYLLDEDTPQ